MAETLSHSAPAEQPTRFESWSLLRAGGAWLGAAREFIKCRFPFGDRVTWGSTDRLGEVCVCDIEQLAAAVTAADRNDREQDLLRLAEGCVAALRHLDRCPHDIEFRLRGSLRRLDWGSVERANRAAALLASLSTPTTTEGGAA